MQASDKQWIDAIGNRLNDALTCADYYATLNSAKSNKGIIS